jgi:catechol 2,3-dioxygenase-like lactoylglutathione lyase family enzyme
MDMKLELIAVPVSDVDRAKAFYTEKLGFNADFDQRVDANLRFVQLTPPGSACSICIGEGLTQLKPGSLDLIQMVVASAQEVHDDLAARGVEVSDVAILSWGSFVYLSDPDGNRWALQERPKRD